MLLDPDYGICKEIGYNRAIVIVQVNEREKSCRVKEWREIGYGYW